MSDAERIRARIEALRPWYHTVDLPGGGRIERDAALYGGPRDYPRAVWDRVRDWLPGMSGLACLDVGANSGFFAREMKRLGAGRVLAVEPHPPFLAQARLVQELSGLDYEVQGRSIYDLDGGGEPFDVILFLGVLYHLKHPLLALEKLAGLLRGVMVVESAVFPGPPGPPAGPGSRQPAPPDYGGAPLELRFIAPSPDRRGKPEELRNWFVPSLACLRALIEAAGLEVVAERTDGLRALVLARRG